MKSPLIEPLEARIAPAVISIAAPSVNTKNEGNPDGVAAAFDFTVSISAAQAQDVTVTVNTLDLLGEATGGEDYVAQSNVTVTIPAGQTSAIFTVQSVRDTKFESDEDFSVALSNPSGGHTISPTASSANATIKNDDALPKLRIVDAKVDEGNAGTKQLTFTVELENQADQPITFDWSTMAGGTHAATPGEDYVEVGTTQVTIPANTSSTSFSVTINGDLTDEFEETFFANITNAKLGSEDLTITDGQAIGRIGNDERTVSVSGSPTVTEGNSGTQSATFTANLTEVAPYDVTVTFTVAGNGVNPAASGSDFQIPNITVTIPAGQTSANFSVPIVGDTIFEATETYAVTLTDAVNATVAGSPATGTILDNDTMPTVSILSPADSPKNEGSTAGEETDFSFRIVLSQVAGVPVTVLVSTQDGTATAADGDYDSQTLIPITIPAGQTQALFTVKVNQDGKRESDETLIATISNPTNATLATTAAQATIRNDDPLPTLTIGDVTQAEGNAGSTTYQFTVTLSSTADQAVNFMWSTAAGTATAGVDFTNVAATMATIAAGQTQTTLSVTVNGDVDDELDETFFVNLSSALLGGTPVNIVDAQGAGRIQNDERTVSIADAGTVVEGDTGTTNAVFVVSLDQSSTHDVIVTFNVQNGTATAGTDFDLPTPLTATIPAGQTSVNIMVPVRGDVVYEQDEAFSVKLTSASHALLGTDTGNATIQDNEAAPTLSILDSQITEGNDGTKVLSFTVSLSRLADEDVTFNWNTANGSALAGSDFVEVLNGLQTIPAGSMSRTISVTLNGDTQREGDETFLVQLTNPMIGSAPLNNAGGDAEATGTILEDDPLPTLSIADAKITEGNAGTKQLTFTVTASNAADEAITFDWATTLGTATVGIDYTAVTSAMGAIAAGATSTTISVDLLGDTDDELDETFFVNIVNAKLGASTSLAITDNQAMGTIENDDLTVDIVPTLTIAEGNTGTTNANFAISIPQASAHDVTVTFQLIPDTALAGSDYQLPAQLTVVIPAGQTSANIVIPIVGDAAFEPNENFSVKLTDATNAVLGNDTALATINNDDGQPTISVADATIEEGDSGTRTLNFTVALSNPASQDITFKWNTADGTATSVTGAGQDFVPVGTTTVTILAGQTTANVSVTLNGDATDELDETFFVNLTEAKLGGTDLTISDGQATGTIENDDTTVRISGGTITEGDSGTSNLNFAVSLLQPSANDVTVTLQLANGTALAGVDYQVPGVLTVTIPAGQTTVNFAVPIIGDTIDEANEAFTVSLTSATNAKLGVSTATGTITDNDASPTLSVDDVTVLEGASGNTAMVFHVSLSAASGQPVSVLVSPQSGTAVIGTDFTGSAITLTFAPGETEKTFTVQALGDGLFENDETFSVVLSNQSGATILDGTGTGTITNDEAQPTLSISDVTIAEASGAANTTFTFTVTLSGPADRPVTVDAATLAGTALEGSDFIGKMQSLTIPAGQSIATFAVSVKQDTIFEADEQFFVNITNARLGGAPMTIADAQGVGTIVNDDAQPTLSIGDVTVVEGNPSGDVNTKEIEFTVSLSTIAGGDVTFTWQTGGGSADGSDYAIVPPTQVTIPAGQNSAKLKVTINADAADEIDDNFFVTLSNAMFGSTPLLITDSQAEGKILNDDLSLSIADVSMVEGDSGEQDMVFTVTLSAPSAHEVVVHYRTQDDTATSSGAAADFTGIGDTVLIFAPGETTKTIAVKVKGDENYDLANAFKVILSQPTNAQIGDGEAVGTITADDDARPVVSVASLARLENADAATTPGTTLFTFHITLDHASDETVQVSASTIAGTAGVNDFTGIESLDLTFAPGETDKTFVVTVTNDDIFELDETFQVVLSDPSNAALGAFQATGTIQADADAAPRLQVTSQEILEGNNGEKKMVFTVQRIGNTEAPISFQFITKTEAGDTAVEGVDYTYTAPGGGYTIAPGESSKTIEVTILGDTTDEADETFTVELTNVTGAQLNPVTDGTAKGKIRNDDLTVSLQQTAVSLPEGSAGQTDMIFLATLSSVSAHDVTVTYSVAAGTAAEGTDYQPLVPLSIVIPAGQLTGEIRVPIQGDGKAEGDETFTVTLTGASQALLATAGLNATGTILNDDAAITISDATVAEGNSGTRNMIFTVTLEDASVFPVTVHYKVDAGTATLGTDFGGPGAVLEGDITFNAGETTKQISVPILGDIASEGDETLSVTLSDPKANGVAIDALLDGTAEGRIQDDEVFLSINDAVISEGDSGTVTATFTITVSPNSAFPVSVRVSTLDLTATSTGGAPDYVSKTEIITFESNQSVKTFSVTINGDRVFESAEEMFKVVLTEANGALVVDGEGTGTIQNSADTAPTLSVSDATLVEGNAGATMMEFTVTLSEASDSDVSFTAATAAAGNTATPGVDFSALAPTVFVIPAGQKTIQVQVPILGDAADETDEQFSLTLSNASTQRAGDPAATTLTITDTQGVGTILNDDLTVNIAPTASVAEGDGGTTTLQFPVTLAQASAHDVTVTFTITGGTATAGSDYTTPATFTVTIPAGQTSRDISVTVSGDLLNENDETVNVSLVSATNAQLGATSSVGTILNDDDAPTVTVSDVTLNEGQSASFTVTLSAASSKDVILKWITVNGTAIGGDGGIITSTQGDFKEFLTAQTLVIPAGSTTATIVVPTVNDTRDELDETFQVKVLDETENADVGPAGVLGTGTIRSNDLSVFSISDASVFEDGADGNGMAKLVFTVSRSGSTLLTSTVDFATLNGTASSAAGDYLANSGTLTFLPGEVSKTIEILVNADTISELDEKLFVNLSSPEAATLGDNSGEGTIRNDEATYRLVRKDNGPLIVDEEAAGGAQQFVEFLVIREGRLDVQGNVSYSTAANNAVGALQATAGTDFTTTSGTILFQPISDPSVTSQTSSVTIRVPILGDSLPEGEETFKLQLTGSVNGQIVEAEKEAVITIHDDDINNLPRVKIEDARLVEGNNGSTDLVFKIKLVGADGVTAQAAGGNITVTYNTADGTATGGGADYTSSAGASVVFVAGQTEREIRVPVLGDTADEEDETVLVNLTDAVFAVPGTSETEDVDFVNTQATGVIVNDDLVLSVSSVSGEPEGNATNLRTFVLSIPQASSHPVSVKYKTVDGTAISSGALADFVGVGTETLVTIAPGETSVSFTIEIRGDAYAEENETFTIQFSDLQGATMSSTTFSATILNDDAQPSISIGDASIVEGDNGQANLVFTVTVAGATLQPITVDYATSDATAKSSGPLFDYDAVSGTLTFAPSAIGGTQTISVPIFGDTWRELTETFNITLTNAKIGGATTGVTISDATGVGTIVDNGDTTLGITIRDAKVVEGNSSSTPNKLTFLVETTAPVTGGDVTFRASTRAGTARTTDFTGLSNQLVTIAAGASSATVEVTVTGDGIFEQSEFLFLDLNQFSGNVEPVNGSGGTLFGRGIIFNDDLRVISAQEFEYIDVDGDLVNVKFSKGVITVPLTGNSNADFTFVPGGDFGGRFLQKIDLSNDGFEFAGTNIIITATPQVLVTGEILGDGKANVGAIDAAVPQAGLFQFTTGIQLGKVVVPGDLGRVIAGSTVAPAGIRDLTVGSLGAGANLPASPVNGIASDASFVLGPIGKMTVNGDVVGSLSVIGDAFAQPIPGGGVGKIGTLIIKGKLKGGSNASSGQIAFTAGIGSATIGGIEGGSGQISGTLLPVDGRFNTTIGSLTVLGDITGGSGDNSGFVNANKIGKVTLGKIATRATDVEIKGSIVGGTGQQSGNVISGTSLGAVTINGDIRGHSGQSSGQLFAATTMGATRITGDIVGGLKDASNATRDADTAGSIVVGIVAGSLTIEGNIIGGTGDSSGVVVVRGITANLTHKPGNASAITIGKAANADSGDIRGGGGAGSGFLQIDGNLPKLTLFGDLIGGTSNATGGVVVNGKLGNAVFKGSLLGGDTAGTEAAPVSIFRSGFIDAGNIASLIIEGHVESGENKGTGSTSLSGSGSISSASTIARLQVLAKDGDEALKGNTTSAVVITARNGIGNASFAGSVAYAEILAGYTQPASSAPRGGLVNAGATIGTVKVSGGAFTASSIVAGVDAGGDGKFGTLDDQQQTSGQNPPGNQNLISRIASVILESVADPAPVPGETGTPSFGIVAERVDSVKIGGVAVSLNGGPHNDTLVVIPGSTKTKVNEI